MSERYYSVSTNYPYAIQSIVERVIVYFAELLYPNETLTNARKRIVLANFDDDAASIRKSIEAFKNSNGTFPFTAYNISDDEPVPERTNYQKNGNFYSTLVGAYVRYIPMILTIPMVTYFTTPFDFWRAMTLFAADESDMTRLDVPVVINGVTCSFVIDLEYTTERGSLAWDIEQQFGVGKLYPVVHTIAVKGAYITLDLEKNSTTGVINQARIVYPVDDIIFYLKQLEDEALIEEKHSPDNPVIVSSTPLNNATEVSRTNPIVITFSESMNETSVSNNIDFVPAFYKQIEFDISGKILTITPAEPLTSSTEYSILINDNAMSDISLPLLADYELNFTTGTV
jgi:hypothetical protein